MKCIARFFVALVFIAMANWTLKFARRMNKICAPTRFPARLLPRYALLNAALTARPLQRPPQLTPRPPLPLSRQRQRRTQRRLPPLPPQLVDAEVKVTQPIAKISHQMIVKIQSLVFNFKVHAKYCAVRAQPLVPTNAMTLSTHQACVR